MGSFVGTISADGFRFRVRPVDYLGIPEKDGAELAAIWQRTFDENTLLLARALLRYEWHLLSASVVGANPIAGNEYCQLVPVIGVGLAYKCRRRKPPTVGNVSQGIPREAGWIYLIDGMGRARLFVYRQTGIQAQLVGTWRLKDLQNANGDGSGTDARLV